MRRVCLATLASAIVAGCPASTSRLMHDKELPETPDISCIEGLLRNVAKDGRVQAITDKIPLGTNHGFVFDVAAVPHHLGILVRPNGTSVFRHVAWAPKLKLRELHDAEGSLTRIEMQLSGHCKLGDLARDMARACSGKNCDRFQMPPNTSLERGREQ